MAVTRASAPIGFAVLAGLVGTLAGCAVPASSERSTDVVRASAQGEAVEIRFEQDAGSRLTVRYRAPTGVTRLKFFMSDPRIDAEVRRPFLVPADDCGLLVPGGIELKRDAACADGAIFVVRPRVLALNAMQEAAQPDSDGGVLFYTGYYAAGAQGVETNWTFVPQHGGYVVDDGRRHDEVVRFVPDAALAGKPLPRDTGFVARQAQRYVYLGRVPTRFDDGLLWVGDPALPPAAVQAVVQAAHAAWHAYADATGVRPRSDVAIVMLRAKGSDNGFRDFHGDVVGGNMIRLSFIDPPEQPDAAQIERWRQFVAHELAHLWNAGVYGADSEEPWLAEGDADWIGWNVLHDAGLMSDASFAAHLDVAVDRCMSTRGDRPAAAIPKDWSHRLDDPYACGAALQLLGWAQSRARDPSSTESAVQRWADLHRAHPRLDASGFAQFFDQAEEGSMHQLLFDDKLPFASVYRKNLSDYAQKALSFQSQTDMLRELHLMPPSELAHVH